jgi:SAM-dependent methyltransferase
MLAECRQRLSGLKIRASFIITDASAIPLPEHSLDGILAIGVLDSLADVPGALHEMKASLKPGARFYAATGAWDHLRELCDILSEFVPGVRLGSASDRFTCENGQAILEGFFKQVNSWDFDDQLTFTQERDVMAYIQSETAVSAALREEDVKQLAREFKRRIKERGSIVVTAHKVLFEALA